MPGIQRDRARVWAPRSRHQHSHCARTHTMCVQDGKLAEGIYALPSATAPHAPYLPGSGYRSTGAAGSPPVSCWIACNTTTACSACSMVRISPDRGMAPPRCSPGRWTVLVCCVGTRYRKMPFFSATRSSVSEAISASERSRARRSVYIKPTMASMNATSSRSARIGCALQRKLPGRILATPR